MKQFFYEALEELCPGVGSTGNIDTKQDFETKCYIVSNSGTSYDFTKFGSTWEELETKMDSLQAEWDAQEYARNRKVEYDVLNQLELQFDDQANDTTTWVDAIEAIKAKYPKP